jgi:hypothetical protein
VDETPVSEKRQYRRYEIWFPVTLAVGEREVWAICRDVSPAGVLVSAVTPLEVGTTASARFRLRPSAEGETVATATVVRAELNRDELVLAFPYRIALEFAAPLQGLLEELSAISEKTKV